MTEQSLDGLGRQLSTAVSFAVDAPGGEKVSERMQPVFRLACLIDNARSLQHRVNADSEACLLHRPAVRGREYKIGLELRASEFPFLQCRKQHLAVDRNGAPTGPRLRRAHRLILIGPLPDMNLQALQVHIGPSQATQLTGS